MTILASAPQAVQLIFWRFRYCTGSILFAILLNIVLPKDKKTEA